MKKLSIFLSTIMLFVLSCSFIFNRYHNSMEYFFIGEWLEVAWEFEQADDFLVKKLGFTNPAIDSDAIRYHKGERWRFKPQGKLEIIDENNKIQYANWYLKGRGNILVVTDNNRTEYFDIRKKLDGEIEMQYMSEMQVKENSKLVFKQINKV